MLVVLDFALTAGCDGFDILAFEGDGNVVYFEGSYTDYEANKLKRLGLEEPRRIRYRKLTED